MLRILHIAPHVRAAGNGICNVVVDLACLQAQAGFDVAVASEGGQYEALLTSYGAKHFYLDRELQPIKILKSILRYPEIVREFHPNIVHVHTPRGVLLASFFKKFFKYALVGTMHSSNYGRNAKIMGSLTDRTIAVAENIAQKLEQLGVAQAKLRVVPNGTLGSPRNPQLTEITPQLLQHPAITTVAGISSRKGIAELIDAFEQIALDFPDAHLYLVGGGSEIPMFEKQAKSTSVCERIHFEGFQSEPQRYMIATDIFVLASRQDPSPLVLPEARESGCAIVATSVDGIPEALDFGEAGLLVPPRDSQALADALRKLLSNPDLISIWKDRALKNLERLTVERVSQETIAVYSELVPGK